VNVSGDSPIDLTIGPRGSDDLRGDEGTSTETAGLAVESVDISLVM
jgi:hypothetical protein